jgi:hypothetical protein
MSLDQGPRRALNVTGGFCVAAAVVTLLVAAMLGRPVVGIAVAAGLMLGAGNGILAQRLLAVGVPFAATSLLRLLALTGVALASGVFLGWKQIVLVVVGMAVAQLVLSAVSAREILRR